MTIFSVWPQLVFHTLPLVSINYRTSCPWFTWTFWLQLLLWSWTEFLLLWWLFQTMLAPWLTTSGWFFLMIVTNLDKLLHVDIPYWNLCRSFRSEKNYADWKVSSRIQSTLSYSSYYGRYWLIFGPCAFHTGILLHISSILNVPRNSIKLETLKHSSTLDTFTFLDGLVLG